MNWASWTLLVLLTAYIIFRLFRWLHALTRPHFVAKYRLGVRVAGTILYLSVFLGVYSLLVWLIIQSAVL